MKSKSPAQSQPPVHSSSFETPKKKISTSADSCKRVLDDCLHTPKVKRRSSTKKSQRKRRPSDSDEEKIDKKTEENIQQVAMKNNLTEDAVKKILKKVVSNDHVIAIVKLKEEEMNNQVNKSTDDEEDEEDRDVEEHAPKITRSKAKVLNKIILPITSPSEPSEASILIQQELRSDDEDEEYEPGNEDVHSDDDHNSSVSDMDSQPRTPRTPYTAEEDTPTKYTNDGLFKIPRDLNDSSSSSFNDQDYIIAKRTRSKVSLATTSIETIESTFQPPDISPDMYDRDNELDTDWLEFLNVLTKPINQTVEDDDETDPEYVAAADQLPIDKEELREVNISKKELNDLVDELFSNLSDVDFDEINKYDIMPELFRTKQKSNKNDSNQEMNRSGDIQSDHDNSFRPSEISTPISIKEKLIRNSQSSTIVENDSTVVSTDITTASQSSLLDLHHQTSTLVTLVNPFQGATFVNGVLQVPQYQQILMQIPTTDILKMQSQQQKQQQQQQSESITCTPSASSSQSLGVQQYQPILIQIPAIDVLKLQAQPPNQQLQSQTVTSTVGQSDTFAYSADHSSFVDNRVVTKTTIYQSKLFQHLKTDLPTTVRFDEGLQGFTQHQREILDQQLRMHVQFAAQNFLQVYGNPGNNLWKQAPKLKSFLTELDDLTSGSSIAIANLRPALNVINKWESDLMEPDTDANKEYAEFLLGQMTKSQNAIKAKVQYIPKFADRMMDAVATSVAFPYPHLLPKIPFRMDFREKQILSEFIAMEDYLIAFYLEKLQCEYDDERVRNKRESKSKVSLERICDRICTRLCSFRLSHSKNSVYRYVCRRKCKSEVYNPIQYYFQHKRAPPFHHKLIKIDCNNLRAPKDYPFEQLPMEWAERIKQLLAIEHSKNITIQNRHSRAVKESTPTTSQSVKSPPKPIFVVRSRNNPSANLSVPIQYEIVEVNSATQLGEVDLTGNIEVPVDSADCRSNKVTQVNKRSTKVPRKILIEKSPKNQNVIKSAQTLTLSQIFATLQDNYFNLQSSNKNKNLLDVHSSVRDFSVYMNFVAFNVNMANVIKRTGKEKGADELNRKPKLTDDVVEAQENNNPSNTTTVNVSTKKNPKAQRSDNTRLMLLPETKEDINEKDMVYAQNFMDKVEEIYVGENKSEKVKEFLHILQTFNQSTDKVEELYYKMEQLFLPEHPELVELFLTFLLPGHAAEIGKFMEHFMLTNMNNFINKLNIYFNKQPAQIRKIMTCLRDLSNEQDLKLEQIKLKIFPLLKGNPLLIEWFKQCFPNETSNDCPADEFESLSFYKAENSHQADDENDVYENVNQSEIIPDPVDNPCHIRYLNGRVYYGSRILLPAKLSFLVVTASDQNAINEAAKTSEPCHTRHKGSSTVDGNETDYRCVHSIKQFGDNKMKECQKNQLLETPDNSTCEDVDIDKSADEQNCSDATDDAEPQPHEPSVQQSDEKNLSSSVESLENVYNTCDDLTLKAHGIRLNPTVHQSNVIKSEDLLCLLDPIDDIGEKVSEESLKNSPKKHSVRGQRKSSPNAKKSTKRSPVNSRKTQQGTSTPAEDSNAIRTAKRLKRLIESDDPDEQPDRSTKKPKLAKSTKPTPDGTKNRKSKLSSSDEGPTLNTTKAETSTSTTEPSTPVNTWSRDEDKLVLEQIKMGFTDEENLVQTLHKEKLPNRSYSEIFDRFKFLMDIIANL